MLEKSIPGVLWRLCSAVYTPPNNVYFISKEDARSVFRKEGDEHQVDNSGMHIRETCNPCRLSIVKYGEETVSTGRLYLPVGCCVPGRNGGGAKSRKITARHTANAEGVVRSCNGGNGLTEDGWNVRFSVKTGSTRPQNG